MLSVTINNQSRGVASVHITVKACLTRLGVEELFLAVHAVQLYGSLKSHASLCLVLPAPQFPSKHHRTL